MKSALVHDWLTSIAGAEKCLQMMGEVFPSPLFALVKNEAVIRGTFFENQSITTSFIQKLPKAKKHYRRYLPLFPLAIEQFDLSDYDLILSSSHAVAKGVLTHAEQLHICYCHTPMRYAWDLYHHYVKEAKLKKGVRGACAKFFLHYLRLWDAHTADRVDEYIANSHYIAKRIRKIYKREATIIYPPVDTDFFQLEEKKEDFYVTASRFVPYKKIDLIVEAFSSMPDKKLVVIGEGPEKEKIKRCAKKNIEFLGYVEDEVLREHLKRAKAFIFAALEDFGILPVEAQACGTPVIAYGRGGALETVKEGETGLFFFEQTVEGLRDAVQAFEKRKDSFSPHLIRKHAETFSEKRFKEEFKAFVLEKYEVFKNQY